MSQDDLIILPDDINQLKQLVLSMRADFDLQNKTIQDKSKTINENSKAIKESQSK
jgi:hypothetical protein